MNVNDKKRNPMATKEAGHQFRGGNDCPDDSSSSSDFIPVNRYTDIQEEFEKMYTSITTFVAKEDFKTHIKKNAHRMDKIEEQLRLQELDVMKTECPIVIAGETSCGKSSIINLILGEMILPTSITASTSRVCRIKHSKRCMVSTRNSKDEEIESFLFENSMEMAKKLETLAQTDDEEISYVDIYMPVPLLQGNVIIVDTPGCGDKTQQKVADRMMSYLPNALAFVFVLNVPNSGGIQDDRLIPVLSKVNQSLDKMVSFSPEDVIFLLNKWDTIDHESVQKLENFFEQSKKSLHKNWEKVDDSCIFRISAIKVAKRKPKYTKDFDSFLMTLKEVIARNENKRVKVHLRFLNDFLDECNTVVSTKLETANREAGENQTTLDDSSKKLEQLEETRKEEISNIERNIDQFFDEASSKFHQYINHPCFKAAILQDTDELTRFTIRQELDTRIENKTKDWMKENLKEIFERTIMADLISKFEEIQRSLHSIKDNLKGFKTPFNVDKKIATAVASGVLPSGAGVIGSFLIRSIISHPGVLIGIVTVGIVTGVVFSGLVAFEVVDDFETVRDKAFEARINVFTEKEIKRRLKKEYYDGVKRIVSAFLEGDLEEEIINIKDNVKTMQTDSESYKAQKNTLSTLKSTVVRELERLQKIERTDIKPE